MYDAFNGTYPNGIAVECFVSGLRPILIDIIQLSR